MRRLLLPICLAVLIAGCTNGELSLADYAREAEQLLTEMNRRIDTLEAEIQQQGLTLESAREFWGTAVDARVDFLDGLGAIDPPEEAAEMHTAALNIVGRLKTADEAVAELVRSMETEQELSLLAQSPEYLATQAVDEEAVALCKAAQAQFDSTADREVFGDMPWVPTELREVVTVAFGCTREERGLDE